MRGHELVSSSLPVRPGHPCHLFVGERRILLSGSEAGVPKALPHCPDVRSLLSAAFPGAPRFAAITMSAK